MARPTLLESDVIKNGLVVMVEVPDRVLVKEKEVIRWEKFLKCSELSSGCKGN